MPPRRLTYDERSGRYRGPDGRYIGAAQVRADLDAAIRAAGDRMNALARRFQAREIGLVAWELEARRIVKQTYIMAAQVAKGGALQMTAADYGRVGQQTRAAYGYLRQWAKDVRAGRAPVDGRFQARGRLYAQSARALYHAVERGEMQKRGYTMEANVLAPAEHCAVCVAQTARGRVPIGTLVPVGQRTCMVNCRCRIAYSRGATGEVAA